MSTRLRFPIRTLSTLVVIIVVFTASFGTIDRSPAIAGTNPTKVFLPVLVKPGIVTPFGAYLDAPGQTVGVDQMSTTSMTWTRVHFYWTSAEPSMGNFNWAAVAYQENILKAVAANHMKAILYLRDTPAWALKAGFTCGAVAQDKFPALGQFLTELVKRYSLPPYNVKYYELWNEPDVSGQLGCWGDPSDTTYFGGSYYGEMLKTAYPAIKAGNPQAQVLFGGLLMDCNADHMETCISGGTPAVKLSIARFFEGALANGAGPYFDGVSYHGYDYYGSAMGKFSNPNWGANWTTTGPVSVAKGTYLKNVLARYNVTGKIVMNTELALLCGSTGQEPQCLTPEHEATVSSYLVQGMVQGKVLGLAASIWFSVSGWRGSGLLNSDAALTPLPPFYAFKFARAKLGEATFTQEVTAFSGVKGYEFSSNGRRLWVLWSTTASGNPHNLTLATTPLAVYDTYGNPQTPSSSLPVGLMPVYVEFAP
jgi:hypothetical protein